MVCWSSIDFLIIELNKWLKSTPKLAEHIQCIKFVFISDGRQYIQRATG